MYPAKASIMVLEFPLLIFREIPGRVCVTLKSVWTVRVVEIAFFPSSSELDPRACMLTECSLSFIHGVVF